MAAALDRICQLQSVAAARLGVRDAVVVMDDFAAAVFRGDSTLMAALVNGGALRIIALQDVRATCRECAARAPRAVGCAPSHALLLVADVSDDVELAFMQLEQAFGNVRVRQIAPSGEPHNLDPAVCAPAPLFFQPLPGVPQPLVLLHGAPLPLFPPSSAARAGAHDLGALPFQAAAMMEVLSGGDYHVFALGAKPRALAAAIRERRPAAAAAAAAGAWADGGGEKAHLLVLERTGDLLAPLLAPGPEASLLSHALAMLPAARGGAPGPRFVPARAARGAEGDALGALGAAPATAAALLRAPRARGLALLRESLAAAAAARGGAAGGAAGDEEEVEALLAALRGARDAADAELPALVRGGGGGGEGGGEGGGAGGLLALLELADLALAAGAADSAAAAGGGGPAGALSVQYAAAARLLRLTAGEGRAEDTLVQLAETLDAAGGAGAPGLRVRHALALALVAYAALGQGGRAEEAGADDIADVLKGSLESKVKQQLKKLAVAEGRAPPPAGDQASEVAELLARLTAVARRHERACTAPARCAAAPGRRVAHAGSAALQSRPPRRLQSPRRARQAAAMGAAGGEVGEAAGGRGAAREYKPMLAAVVQDLVNNPRAGAGWHHHVAGAGAGAAGALPSVSSVFGFGSSLLARAAGEPDTAPALGRAGCAVVVVLVLGGVTLDESEAVRTLTGAGSGAAPPVLLVGTELASMQTVLSHFTDSLPLLRQLAA